MNRETNTQTPMVTLKTIDRLVGLLIGGIVLFGSYSWWQATQRVRMRNGMMGMMPGMDPIWYPFGTLIVVSVILGVYVISREQLADMLSTPTTGVSSAASTEVDESGDSDARSSELTPEQSNDTATDIPSSKQASALTFLPEDERRVIEPVLESPGLTQVELRGRSRFSKAKVSQTVSELEDRGLIYREKQGRTYRVYPGELLKDQFRS